MTKLSKRLKKSIPEIMNLWEIKAIEKMKGTKISGALTLRNSLPEFLLKLVDVLSTPVTLAEAKEPKNKKSNNEVTARMGKEHGKDRARTSYTMNHMILEYHILRLVIFDVLEREVLLKPSERELIITTIEQAVSGAATEFSSTLNDVQEQLANTLAHDLRNPISAAKVSAQLILRRADHLDNCISSAIRISTCMDRLDKMISDLLDASRVRAGEVIELELKDCDLDWLVTEVANELNISYTGRFIVESSGECLGYWNESGLRRLIENLGTNAIKYGEENASITISLIQDEETATLSIHNTGKHITPNEQSLMFEPFHRSRSAEKKIGWGLGLTMVKGMVDAHKGSIKIESEKKKGTTFIVNLPKDSRETSLLEKHDLYSKYSGNLNKDSKVETFSNFH